MAEALGALWASSLVGSQATLRAPCFSAVMTSLCVSIMQPNSCHYF